MDNPDGHPAYQPNPGPMPPAPEFGGTTAPEHDTGGLHKHMGPAMSTSAPAPPPVPPAEPQVGAVAPDWQTPSFGSVPPSAPAAPAFTPSAQNPKELAPMAVVQVLSTRGVEYTMMMLCLWLAAASLIWVLLALINGGAHFNILSFPISLMLVCVPVFGWFFLRLKKAELNDPQLKLDPSKRRLTQFTQVIAFAACLFNLIAFVYLIFSKMSGSAGPSLGKTFLNLIIILLVAGGVLVYYWNDEHRE
ncbi:MAG TPA: hypothetical protein VFI84_01015 [Candidatus Saccharimonadales bacterium]|nr:hypothetical protein [Candidatus Saccharimonadales bacterium]